MSGPGCPYKYSRTLYLISVPHTSLGPAIRYVSTAPDSRRELPGPRASPPRSPHPRNAAPPVPDLVCRLRRTIGGAGTTPSTTTGRTIAARQYQAS
eukprot:3940327-Rhodomonas_salina.2